MDQMSNILSRICNPILEDGMVFQATITGLRISSVNGTALIDNAGAVIPTYADGNHLIEIYNAARTTMLKGVLKAAGSGETLGEEKITTWTNNGYETLTLDGSDIDSAIETGGASSTAYNDYGTSESGKLYKLVIGAFTKNSGGSVRYHMGSNTTGLGQIAGIYFTAAAGEYYRTSVAISRYHGFRTDVNSNWTATGISEKQVTAPSTSGATIVNAKGGTTYNWLTNTFGAADFNLESYYCVVKLIR